MTTLTRRTIHAVIPILVGLITTTSFVAAQRTRKPKPLRLAPGMSRQLQGDLKPGQTAKFAITVKQAHSGLAARGTRNGRVPTRETNGGIGSRRLHRKILGVGWGRRGPFHVVSKNGI